MREVGNKGMSASDEGAICDMLDCLMLAKNRPLLSDEAKDVWIDDLRDQEPKRIKWAINKLRRSVGPFPEVANIIEGCREYAAVHAEQIAEENRVRFNQELLDYEKEHAPKLPKSTRAVHTPDEMRKMLGGGT